MVIYEFVNTKSLVEIYLLPYVTFPCYLLHAKIHLHNEIEEAARILSTRAKKQKACSYKSVCFSPYESEMGHTGLKSAIVVLM